MEDADFRLNPEVVDSPYRFQSIAVGGSILSSPIAVEGKIIFGCNDTHIYCLDAHGNKMWSVKTGDMVFSSPTAYKDMIFIGSNDKHLYAVSPDGEVKWKFLAGDKIYSTPLVIGGVVYFGSNDGFFRALSADDGKELWKRYCAAGVFFMSASGANDSIFFGHINGDVSCISREGKLLWKTPTGDHATQTPLVLDKNNNVLCSFGKRSLQNFPRYKNCRIFLASGDGFFRSIDAGNGEIDWKVFCNRTGASCPAFWNNTFYFGSTVGNLNAVGIDGRLKWKYQTGNKIVSSPIVHDGVVYFGSSDHNIYAVDGKTGELKWRFLTNGEVVSSPVIEKNILYACSWDCHMYAIDIVTKELLWRFRTSMAAPSFISRPTMADAREEGSRTIHEPVGTKTTSGRNGEKQYSIQAGELTNTFYGLPSLYNRKKTGYDFGTEAGNYKK